MYSSKVKQCIQHSLAFFISLFKGQRDHGYGEDYPSYGSSDYPGYGSSDYPSYGSSEYPGFGSEKCCKNKLVGGKVYRLVETSNEAYDFDCTSSCVYRTAYSDVKYCFKPGGHQSECLDDPFPPTPITPEHTHEVFTTETPTPEVSNTTTHTQTGFPTGSPAGKCRSVSLLSVSTELNNHDRSIL